MDIAVKNKISLPEDRCHNRTIAYSAASVKAAGLVAWRGEMLAALRACLEEGHA